MQADFHRCLAYRLKTLCHAAFIFVIFFIFIVACRCSRRRRRDHEHDQRSTITMRVRTSSFLSCFIEFNKENYSMKRFAFI